MKKISKFFLDSAYSQLSLCLITPCRFSEEEMVNFQAIMKLEHGFEKVVDACAADTDVLLSLIRLVSDYMRTI